MAWWFFLTIVSYVLIWLVTSDQDTIPPSLLGMLGISAATALAAVAVTPSSDSTSRRRELFDAEIAAVALASDRCTIDLSEADTKVGLHADALRTALSKRLADLQARRMELEIERANPSRRRPPAGGAISSPTSAARSPSTASRSWPGRW